MDSWAPDGSTLTAHHHPVKGNSRRLMIPMSGQGASEPQPLLPNVTAPVSDTVFSPDGRYVAFVSAETNRSEIYIRPFPGPGASIPVSVGGGVEPAWARNGELFYRRLSDYAMMAVSVTTAPKLTVSPPKELFAGSTNPGGSPRARYAVSADGQRFLMNLHLMRDSPDGSDASRQKIVVVLNWLEELKRMVGDR